MTRKAQLGKNYYHILLDIDVITGIDVITVERGISSFKGYDIANMCDKL